MSSQAPETDASEVVRRYAAERDIPKVTDRDTLLAVAELLRRCHE